MQDIQTEIEQRPATAEPDVEVLLAERVGGGTVRVFVDREGGVDLGVCERITKHLGDLLADYSLEVSSPGPERPLSKPGHFRRYVGRRAKVKTTEEHGGRKSFTGELVGASDDAVTIAADNGVVSIPYADIKRSNLVEG